MDDNVLWSFMTVNLALVGLTTTARLGGRYIDLRVADTLPNMFLTLAAI